MPARQTTRVAQITFGVLLVVAFALLALLISPLWRPLFLAAVLASAASPWNEWLARKIGGRRKLASAATTALLVLLVLIPITVLVVVAFGEAVSAVEFVRNALERGGIDELVRALPKSVEEPLRDVLALVPADMKSVSGQAAFGGKIAATVASTLANVAFTLAILLIAFYAFLINGERLARWLHRISPLPETDELLQEARSVSGYVLRSSFIISTAQGIVATVGYIIAGVPNPVFFGLVTFVTAFIPGIGTMVVGVPLAGLLALSGHVWQPIFLAAWILVVVGLIDTLLRPVLIRGEMQLDGVVVFFSLIGGISVFGGLGLLIGPLTVTFFLAMVRFAYRDYVQAPIARPGGEVS